MESGVGHAQKTPLKGLRFESLEEAQAYLDHWEERWADTRIHGTTKRQVAVMFAEERPALAAVARRTFPLLPIRRAHGASGWLRGSGSGLLQRAAGLDRQACPGAMGSPAGALAGSADRPVTARAPARRLRGGHRIKDEDRPKHTPLGTQQLLCRADKAGSQIGAALPRHARRARRDSRCAAFRACCRWPRSTASASVEDACAAALEVGVCEYRFVRRYLERNPQLPLSLRQVDPLIRQLTDVSRLHRQQNQGEQTMNLIELQRALRQLRLGGIAAVLETRLRQAQAEAMAPIDLISCLVSDELTRRSERLLERRRKQAAFRDPHKTLDNFDFTFNPKMNRSLVFDLATCAFIGKREDALFPGPGGTGKSHLARPSAKPPSNRAIACSIAKPTCCWTNWPRPSSTARARSSWNRWRPCRCSSSTYVKLPVMWS